MRALGRILSRQTYRDALLGAGLLLAALALVAWPGEASAAMKDGLALCGNVILPSLFPFFVLSSLVVELGLSRYLGRLFQPVMAPLFRVNGACAAALALGFVGGYPVGARTAISLYQNGQCSRTEAERLLAFCNNCGPAFILGVVGTGVFGSGAAGLLLYLGHLAASLLVGILFRFYKSREGPKSGRAVQAQFQTASFPAAFTKSVTGALQSTLNICAFVLFFTVVIRALTLSGALDGAAEGIAALFSPLGMDREWARRLLTGALEMSSGVSSLTVHCQVLAFLGDSGLSLRTYVTDTLLHGALSAAVVGGLVRLIPLPGTVSALLAGQTEAIAGLDFHRSLTLSAAAAWGTWLVFLALAVWAVKKNSGKCRRHGV